MQTIIKVIYLNSLGIKSEGYFNIFDKKIFNELIKYKCPVRFNKLLYSDKNNFEELREYIKNKKDNVVVLDFSDRTVKYSDMEIYIDVLCRNDYDPFISETKYNQDKYGNYIN
jgi:hypothetical protein